MLRLSRSIIGTIYHTRLLLGLLCALDADCFPSALLLLYFSFTSALLQRDSFGLLRARGGLKIIIIILKKKKDCFGLLRALVADRSLDAADVALLKQAYTLTKPHAH